jgi:hypothetical protein
MGTANEDYKPINRSPSHWKCDYCGEIVPVKIPHTCANRGRVKYYLTEQINPLTRIADILEGIHDLLDERLPDPNEVAKPDNEHSA